MNFHIIMNYYYQYYEILPSFLAFLYGGTLPFDHLIINLFSLYVLFPSSDHVMFSREFAFCHSCYVPFVSGVPLNLLKSVIIR